MKLFLDTPFLTTAQAAEVSGTIRANADNWAKRGLILAMRRNGGFLFSLSGCIRLAAMQMLTGDLGMAPAEARRVAQLIEIEIEQRAPKDD